jgi:prephenate dehydratase
LEEGGKEPPLQADNHSFLQALNVLDEGFYIDVEIQKNTAEIRKRLKTLNLKCKSWLCTAMHILH